MKNAYTQFAQIPQTEPLDARQAPNNAGGFSYTIDPFVQLERFLILGSEGGTYYVSERQLTRANAACVAQCLALNPTKTIDLIVAISRSGRAPKNDPALFALALAVNAVDLTTRRYALSRLGQVCRIPTHLFHFLDYCQATGRGWGRGLRTAIDGWYTGLGQKLPYELAKYQQRDGWSHADVLRKAHVTHPDQPALRWALGLDTGPRVVERTLANGIRRISRYPATAQLPALLEAVDEAKTCDLDRLLVLIREHGLTREMVPTESLRFATVWEALLEHMPLTALIRNLGVMTAVGVLKPLTPATQYVYGRLTDPVALQKSRVHPVAVLNALRIYSQGHGERGRKVWTPVTRVVDALDGAFYASFGNVKPTGKRLQLAIDISGSMDGNKIAGTALDARTAAAAMALVTAAVEPNVVITAFCDKFCQLQITPKMRLDTVVHAMQQLDLGSTDCALPMIAAGELGWTCDAFVVYTDAETWLGAEHPMAALRRYRKEAQLPHAKLITVGMTATEFTIGDPADVDCLDVVGFDLATPALINDFIAKE